MHDMGKNRKLTDLTQQVADATRQLTAAAMAAAGHTVTRDGTDGTGAVEAIVGGVVVVANSMATLATFLNRGEDINGSVTPDEMLFTAFLVCRCSPANDGEKSVLAFDPSIILDAMEDFEKFTGRKPDDFIIPAMAAAARDCAKEGGALLDRFRTERAAEIAKAERGNSPLN